MPTPANGAPISTAEAKVLTATIAVKVIRLGKRQLTQAVFKQLPTRHIINPEKFTLRGKPWGVVNYHWDGCGFEPCGAPGGTHLHVVYVAGGKLYRSCVGPMWANAYRTNPSRCPDSGYEYDPAEAAWPEGDCAGVAGAGAALVEAFVDKWNKLYRHLAALDQLFIAV
jgi:hypothetical protein